MKVLPAGKATWKFWCPGCDGAHVVNDSWTVNVEAATINPSILVHPHKTLIDSTLTGPALTAPENVTETPLCHSYVTDGRIRFLDDSTHALAGQTVDLPDWEDH